MIVAWNAIPRAKRVATDWRAVVCRVTRYWCWKATNALTIALVAFSSAKTDARRVCIPAKSARRVITAANADHRCCCRAANVARLALMGKNCELDLQRYRIRLTSNTRFRYFNDLGICAKCFLSCMTCSGPRRDQCVTCPRGWQLAAGECHPECPQGFFMSDFGCQKCHHYCRTCKGNYKTMSP